MSAPDGDTAWPHTVPGTGRLREQLATLAAQLESLLRTVSDVREDQHAMSKQIAELAIARAVDTPAVVQTAQRLAQAEAHLETVRGWMTKTATTQENLWKAIALCFGACCAVFGWAWLRIDADHDQNVRQVMQIESLEREVRTLRKAP